MPRPTFLEQEIREQPRVIERLVDAEAANARRIADRIRAEDVSCVWIAARGSSDNAARYAQYLLGARQALPVGLAAPALATLYERPPRWHGLVVGISQSGRSPDVVAVIDSAAAQSCLTLAITNDAASPLAAAAEHVMLLHAGTERSVAATKTYTASLTALGLLSAALTDVPAGFDQLARLPEALEAACAAALEQAPAVDWPADRRHCVVVGRGFNMSTAFEIALKLKELAGIYAEPYSPPDLLHGPIAAARDTVGIVVAPEQHVDDATVDVARELRSRGNPLILLGKDSQRDELRAAEHRLSVPTTVEDWLTPVLAVVGGQALALTLSRQSGADPDCPPGLRKVTKTY